MDAFFLRGGGVGRVCVIWEFKGLTSPFYENPEIQLKTSQYYTLLSCISINVL